MDKPIVPREIKKIYQGRVFSVQSETITLPKGLEMKVDIIRHPGSVVIVPVTDEGQVILIRQYRPAIGKWAWEVPAGTLKDGEDPRDAAVRECHEEIGLIPGRLEQLGSFFPTPGYCDEEMHFYRVSSLREPTDDDEEAKPDEDEDIEPQAFTREALASMVASNEIIDMKTVVALVLLR